jgi:hypothetical protein
LEFVPQELPKAAILSQATQYQRQEIAAFGSSYGMGPGVGIL